MLIHGMKGYNGVAILSRVKLEKPRSEGWCGSEDCRHAIAELPGGDRAAQCLCPGRRRHSRSGGKSEIRAQAALSRRSHGLVQGPAARRQAHHPRGRPQYRAARNRCLVAQAASGRGKPHADRSRKARPASGMRQNSSMPCAISSRPSRSFTPGGAIARAIGPRPTAAGGSTMSGSHLCCRTDSPEQRYTAARAIGSAAPIMSPCWFDCTIEASAAPAHGLVWRVSAAIDRSVSSGSASALEAYALALQPRDR